MIEISRTLEHFLFINQYQSFDTTCQCCIPTKNMRYHLISLRFIHEVLIAIIIVTRTMTIWTIKTMRSPAQVSQRAAV